MARIRRFPDTDEFEFRKHADPTDLESNSTIYCPKLKCWDCICNVCYNCELGFNGVCEKFNEKAVAKPLIIDELYRPVAELFKQDLNSPLIGCDGKILSIGAKRDKRKKLVVLQQKFLLKIRFIPKYEQVTLPYFDEMFYVEDHSESLTYEEMLLVCKSGDTVYSINQSEHDIEAIKLMEKLNV